MRKAKAIFLKFLQQELFSEWVNFLKTELQITMKAANLYIINNPHEKGLIGDKGRRGKIWLTFNAKHEKLLNKHHMVEIFSRNDHRKNSHKGFEYVRNNVEHRMTNLGIQNSRRPIQNMVVASRRGTEQY